MAEKKQIWRRIQDVLALKVEMQQLRMEAASTPSFCITCCISAPLAGTLCQERSVSFLLLVGLITVQAVPSSRCGCKTAHAISPQLLCHLRIDFLFSLCSGLSGGVVTQQAQPRTNQDPDRCVLSGRKHMHHSPCTQIQMLCACACMHCLMRCVWHVRC